MREILSAYKDKLISKDGILTAMEDAIKLGGFYPEMLPPPCLENELKQILNEVKMKINQMKLHDEANKNKLIIGYAMNSLKLRMNGADVSKYIQKTLKEVKS